MVTDRQLPQFAFDSQRIRIHAWAEETTEATVSTPPQAKTSVRLEIPLDSALPVRTKSRTDGHLATEADLPTTRPVSRPTREPVRRDSLKKREALLKGKEGSRRRQRWENDHLLNNPWAQPPEACDWEVRPTYPRTVVPYFLAPLWDIEIAARKDAEQKRRNARARANAGLANIKDEAIGHVPRDLRQKIKRSKGAKQMLQDLENEVRQYLTGWRENQGRLAEAGLHDADSEEDELVFVGRNGQMHDLPPSPKQGQTRSDPPQREKLMIDSAVNDRSAAFGRWLVHSIATYYGLNTWSVTVGDRREAYIGIKPVRHGRTVPSILPRPLSALV